jgi:hypothetical protein
MGSDYFSDSIALTPARPQVTRRQFFCDEVGRRELPLGSAERRDHLCTDLVYRRSSEGGTLPAFDREGYFQRY